MKEKYKIDRIKINGFRRLKEISLPVKSFMVIIGANGVGKTSLLEAFTLLSATASGNMNSSLSKLGGIAKLKETISFDRTGHIIHWKHPFPRYQRCSVNRKNCGAFCQPQRIIMYSMWVCEATWADNLDLNQWLAEYSLDEVWRMGRMGGRS